MPTENNDTIIFSASLTQVTMTLVNAYSGYSVSIDDIYNLNNSVYDGLGGFDTLRMNNNNDVLLLVNSNGEQTLFNVERITASGGNDVIDLSSTSIILGDLNILGSLGDDILWGNVGNDLITGNLGDDHIDGGPGNDILIGEEGNDILYGGDGDDQMLSGADDDLMVGGTGSDIYYVNVPDFGHETIYEVGNFELNTLFMNNGMTYNDITFVFSGDNLIIDAGANGTVTILDQFAGGGVGIDLLKFNDGSEYDLRAVTPPNTDPVAVDDAFSGNEDEVISGNVLTNDSDADGDTLTVVAGTYTTAQGGTVELLENGDFSYSPAADFFGSDSFSYTVNDGQGGSASANVELDVASVNDTPVAVDDIFSGNEDEILTGNVLANDSDADGDTLTVVAGTYTTAQGGSIELSENGDFTYTPATDFFGTDNFNYTVNDGQGGSASANVTLDIADVADPIYPALDIRVSHGNTATQFIDSADGYDLVPEAYGVNYTVQNNVMQVGGASNNAQVSYSFTDANTASVMLDSAWNSMKNVEVSADGAGNITLHNFVHTDVSFGNGGDSTIVITDAKRGFITTGDGNDNINIEALTNNAHWSNVFDIESGAGNDTISFTGDKGITQVEINSGEGDDTVTLYNNYQKGLVDAGNGDDAVQGGTGADTIYGGDGNDHLMGGDGNDILYGGNNDVLLIDKDFADDVLFPQLQERVNINDLMPSGEASLGIKDPNLSVDSDTSASITFRKGGAGYNNSLGSYSIAEDGTIQMASLLWENVKDAGKNVTHQIDLPGQGGDFGFFIIADGDRKNAGYAGLDTADEGHLQFIFDYGGANERAATIYDNGNQISLVYNDGITETVLQGHVYHTTERGGAADLNADGKIHAVSGLAQAGDDNVLKIGFEDLHNLGDADFEDVLFELDINAKWGETENADQGNDLLEGGAGNDILYGEGGNDILIGGSGNDTLYGGSGADMFVLDSFVGSDTVKDFDSELDSINLTDLLDGFDPGTSDADAFIQLVINGGNTQIHVNADGVGTDFVMVATLEGVNLGSDVQALIDDGSMIVNQSVVI